MNQNKPSGRTTRVYWVITIIIVLFVGLGQTPDNDHPLAQIILYSLLAVFVGGLWWITYGKFGDEERVAGLPGSESERGKSKAAIKIQQVTNLEGAIDQGKRSGRKVRVLWVIAIMAIVIMIGPLTTDSDNPLFPILFNLPVIVLVVGLWWITYGKFGDG